jgi:hypothetical protein
LAGIVPFGGQIILTYLHLFYYLSVSHTLFSLSLFLSFSFPGGSYAYVRLCLGNYIGYLTGALESIGLILYTASGTLFFGEMMTEVFCTIISSLSLIEHKDSIVWCFRMNTETK